MSSENVTVWIDHETAKIFHLGPQGGHEAVHVAHHDREAHKTGGPAALDRDRSEQHPFFDDIAEHLVDAGGVLVVGPSDTKNAFVTFVRERHKAVAAKILGVEVTDHPTDGQIVAHAKKFFIAAHRMRAE